MPGDHAIANFGANPNLWDRLHETGQAPVGMGFELGDSPQHQLQCRDLIRSIRPSFLSLKSRFYIFASAFPSFPH